MRPTPGLRRMTGVHEIAATVATPPDRGDIDQPAVRVIHGGHVMAAPAPDIQPPMRTELPTECCNGFVRERAAISRRQGSPTHEVISWQQVDGTPPGGG